MHDCIFIVLAVTTHIYIYDDLKISLSPFCQAVNKPTPVNSDIWGIFSTVFVQAIFERVHCSAGYYLIWYGIPGCCYFNWVKVLGN